MAAAGAAEQKNGAGAAAGLDAIVNSNVPLLPEKFDLAVALQAIADDSPEVVRKLQAEEARLSEIRQTIAKESRKSFVLEKELNEIDEKIKLLIKHRISLQEVEAQTNGLSDLKVEGLGASPIRGKREMYEDLFYLLQSKPRYFAALARKLEAKHIHTFVRTVVFDMYGDQYNTREERLLLDLFKRVLQDELAATNNKGSLLRANTGVTQMLSAYARRGQGLSVLKDILEKPLTDITNDADLNLEVDPMRVYLQIIQDYETKTGKPSELPRDVDSEAAGKNEEVKAIIKRRVAQLLEVTEGILERIVAGVGAIPYGMRWICKQLGVLSKERFPDADRYQISSLMGGYIYLRFFNPVIATPDATNFISKKPNRVMRRNLILIAKILQNLSNGLQFKDKEVYMKVCNPWLESKKEVMQAYFDRLIEVDDLEDALQVDKYLEHTSVHHVNISYEQIFLVHGLLQQHVEVVAPRADDPLRDIVKKLGDAPDFSKVTREENRTVTLQLGNRAKASRDARMSTAVDVFKNPEANPLTLQAKELLLSVLRLLPASPKGGFDKVRTLQAFLVEQNKLAVSENDKSLADHISNVISMLHTLAGMGLLKSSGSSDETFDAFLWEIAREARMRAERVTTVTKRLRLIEGAAKTIKFHHQYLVGRLELYKEYLDNVRRGQARQAEQQQQSKNGKKGGKSKKSDRDKSKKKGGGDDPKSSKSGGSSMFKMTHTELEEGGVIMRTDPSIAKSILKKCYYRFNRAAPGQFQITLHMKKGFDVQLLKKPIVLLLDDLLSMQEHGEVRLDVDYVDLNVNLLIHLFNERFGKGGKR